MTVDDRLCRAGADRAGGRGGSRVPAVARPVQDGLHEQRALLTAGPGAGRSGRAAGGTKRHGIRSLPHGAAPTGRPSSFSTGPGSAAASALRLDATAADLGEETLSLGDGKGRTDRLVPIPGRARDGLDVYLCRARPELVKTATEDGLFLTTTVPG